MTASPQLPPYRQYRDMSTGGRHYSSLELPVGSEGTHPICDKWQRYAAFGIDYMSLLALTVAFQYELLIVTVWSLTLLNSIVLQGLTGQTVGKMVVGIKLVHVAKFPKNKPFVFTEVTPVRCFFRFLGHITDYFCLPLGLVVLWFSKRSQTTVDYMVKTVCIKVR